MEEAVAVAGGRGSEESNGDGGSSSPLGSYWVSSTNWTVRRGSLRDSICFESSSSILESGDDDGESVTSDLILARPAVDDPSPCEITICFRERHEIHRVYVRSTARVYEIYYAPEQQSNNSEYLCTVRCGSSAKEVMLPRSDTGEPDTNQLKDSGAPSEEMLEQMVRSISNTSSDEDGWVEVKVSDSSSVDKEKNTLSKKEDVGTDIQICYEATADISDASPCISLTLRLLSLQTKGCIHVEEIYVYADPVASTDSNPPVSSGGNLAGNPLLAMLVLSLLQLSNAGTNRIQGQDVSDNSTMHTNNFGTAKASELRKPDIGKTVMLETFSSLGDQGKGQVSAPTGLKSVITHLDSDMEVPGPHQVPRSVPEENNFAYSRLEKSLDELVSRVGKIETFFSRFEEKMLKPLTCIETRLQRLERQLDALSVRTGSSEPFQCSRISAPEFSFDESDLDEEGSDTSDVIKQDATVNSPDVGKEDATVYSPDVIKEDTTVDSPDVAKEDATVDSPSFPADETASGLASEMCPGLIVKAPEFLTEDDEYSSSNDISGSAGKYCPKEKVSFSIDNALTSALEAFLLSTSGKSSKASVEAPEFLSEIDHNSCVGETAGRFSCEEADVSGIICHGINRECDVNVDSMPCIAESKEQVLVQQAWPEDSSVEVTAEKVFSNSKYHVGSDAASDVAENHNGDTKGWIDESDAEEAADQALNPNLIWKKWDEDNSSDSSVNENITTNHYCVDLMNGTSTDSVKEFFALHNWLYGHQDDPMFKEATSVGAMRLDHLTFNIGDESLSHNHEKSKVEIERALNSTLNCELQISDVQFASHGTLNSGSSLEALPEKLMDTKFQVSGFKDSSGIISGQQDNSCSSQGVECPIAVNNSLISLQDLSVETNASSLEGGIKLEMMTAKVDCNEDDGSIIIGQQDKSFSLQSVEHPIAVDNFLIDLRDLAIESNTSSLEGSSNPELMDTKVHVSIFDDVDDIIIGQLDNPFLLQGMEHTVAVDNFFIDLQDLAAESDTSSLEESNNLEDMVTEVQVSGFNGDGVIIGQQDYPFFLPGGEHPTASDNFLVDLRLGVGSNVSVVEGSSNQPPFSSLI